MSFGTVSAVPVPPNYVGLSYETAQLGDAAFFAADNHGLVSLFRLLSDSGVLRIGGNSSDFSWWKDGPAAQPPELPASAHSATNWMPQHFTAVEPESVHHLDKFLRATNWKAIYGLNLGTGTPENAAAEAAYVAKTLGPRLLYFQIGNEPEYYRNANNLLRSPDWDFGRYLAQWLTYARAVIQRVPEARFGGPDVGSNGEWVIRFADTAPKALQGKIVACSGHYYAEGPPDNPTTTVQRLLAPNLRFDSEVRKITAAAAANQIVYRMTEGNTCYRGGKPGLSDAFCSSLWAVEFMLDLAARGTAGVNLHGGGAKQIRMALGGHLPGEKLAPDAAAIAAQGSFYTPIAGSREAGFHARPIFYGMRLAGLVAGGKLRQVSLDGAPPTARVWAAEMPEASTRLILLNKNATQNLEVRIPCADPVRLWRLAAPNLTANSGVTLAGAQFEAGHVWAPRREERLTPTAAAVSVTIPAASGAAVFLSGRPG